MAARTLAFLHRWLGIVLCLFFAMWFLTGMVMIYVPFPSVPNIERLRYLDPIDASTIDVDPSQAVFACGEEEARQLRIISLETRPIYVCTDSNNALHATYADTPGAVPTLSAERAKIYAESRVDVPFYAVERVHYDQWVVHQKFDPYRPFYRLELVDGQGTHLYVSSHTGEILQRTTAHARFWNYLGAVAHWIYPTVLRKHWAWWDKTVWWLSLFGIVAILLGIYLGVLRLIKVRRSGQKLFSPFTGWIRWHHIAGLVSGLLVLSWIFSGWLSMDHGRLFSTPNPSDEQIQGMRGISLGVVGMRINVEDLRHYNNAHEITFHAVGGEAFTLSHNTQGVVDPQPLRPEDIALAIDAVWHEADVVKLSVIQSGDAYTDLREGRLPEGTIRVELNDRASTWVHVDRHSGDILSVMDRSRRIYRWLFNGLHSLDVPRFVELRPLWDIVLLLLLVIGLIGSLTGIIVAFRRLLKSP